MILADTSAWVEYLRGTGSRTHRALRRGIDRAEIVTTEPVLMEVLAGARSSGHARRLRTALTAFPLVTVSGLEDYESAATIARACRAAGHELRGIVDCLIAAVALRSGAEVLHRDRDFDVIARHTELRVRVTTLT